MVVTVSHSLRHRVVLPRATVRACTRASVPRPHGVAVYVPDGLAKLAQQLGLATLVCSSVAPGASFARWPASRRASHCPPGRRGGVRSGLILAGQARQRGHLHGDRQGARMASPGMPAGTVV